MANDTDYRQISAIQGNEQKVDVSSIIGKYIHPLSQSLENLDHLWRLLIKEGTQEIRVELQRQTNELSRLACVAGQSQLARQAEELKQAFATMDAKIGESIPQKGKIQALINQARFTTVKIKEAAEKDPHTIRIHVAGLPEIRTHKLICAVDPDTEQSAGLAKQLDYYGYTFENYKDLESLKEAIRHSKPTAILIDTAYPLGGSDNVALISEIQNAAGILVPVLFMSSQDSFTARLSAVRAGGKAYFLKPVNVGTLVEVLDGLTFQDTFMTTPYRVLIVDDSSMQAAFSAAHLKKIGIETSVLTKPEGILQRLAEFFPDLIILDIYMPATNGMEVAGVIRQIESFMSIPIVYLSSETNRDLQLKAMSLGGDDFLTKPIKPEHLVSAVLSRAERYRKLRSLMVRDSLTRLYNNSTIHERLKAKVHRCREWESYFSYCILDVDHFKEVNDVYGHAAGDRALRNLANLLRQRLRRSDIIGRIGGEEFAILFPDTTPSDALKIMEELRLRLAGIQHRVNEATFTITISGGIAGFPKFTCAEKISAAADKALYQAKQNGRNQIVLANL